MKLLLDENLSFRLVSRLSEPFPGTKHLRDLGLSRASDELLERSKDLIDFDAHPEASFLALS